MQRLPSALLGAAAVLVSVHAYAADLPARTAAPVPYVPAVPAFTWTGFYLGVNAGYGYGGSSSFTDPTYGAVVGSGSTKRGFAGGGQVGFNYQFTPVYGFVVGVEADLQAANMGRGGTAYAIGTIPYSDVGSRLDWFGTVRGRIGYAFNRVLVYGTGGFAYGGGSADTTYASLYPYALPNGTRTGYTLGAGVEYAITSNLTAKLEGLYVNLDRGSGTGATYYDAGRNAYYGTGRPKEDFGLVRAGLNYKF